MKLICGSREVKWKLGRESWNRLQVGGKSIILAVYSLAWKTPWMEEPGGLQSMGSLRVGHNWATSLSLFIFMHWRRKWQPTQCSCLENPRGRRAWWAAVSGVTQSRTRLKWLSSSSSLFPSPHFTFVFNTIPCFQPLLILIFKCVLSCSVISDCHSMDCSPPGSSVHGIVQARILEWVATSYSRGISRLRDQICISWYSCSGREFFTTRTSGKLLISSNISFFLWLHQVWVVACRTFVVSCGIFPPSTQIL